MSSQPELILSALDVERLEVMLDSVSATQFPGKASLLAEIDRGDIREPEEMPDNVVTMNSSVRLSVIDSGRTFNRTLVYPRDAGAAEENISILAPVGSAILGLSVGDEIDWPMAGNKHTRVKIDDIIYQPERAGELHR